MEMFDKIQNPKTGKMVKSAGSLGKHIINNPGTHVYNPKTGKNVKVGGKVGKMVMGGYRKTVGGGGGVSPQPQAPPPTQATPQAPSQAQQLQPSETPRPPGPPGEKELIAFLAAYNKEQSLKDVKAKLQGEKKLEEEQNKQYLAVVEEYFDMLDQQSKKKVVRYTLDYFTEKCKITLPPAPDPQHLQGQIPTPKIKEGTSCNKGPMITKANHCNCGDNAAFVKLKTYLKLKESTVNTADTPTATNNLLYEVRDKIEIFASSLNTKTNTNENIFIKNILKKHIH